MIMTQKTYNGIQNPFLHIDSPSGIMPDQLPVNVSAGMRSASERKKTGVDKTISKKALEFINKEVELRINERLNKYHWWLKHVAPSALHDRTSVQAVIDFKRYLKA